MGERRARWRQTRKQHKTREEEASWHRHKEEEVSTQCIPFYFVSVHSKAEFTRMKEE